MPNYPAWNDMTNDQKFEFLHEWGVNLSRAVETLQNNVQNLHERLRKVEAKIADKP